MAQQINKNKVCLLETNVNIKVNKVCKHKESSLHISFHQQKIMDC